MALSYEEAKKMAEDQKYSVTGSKDGIDEGYIKALQNNTLNDYMNKIVSTTKVNDNRGSSASYQPTYQPTYQGLSQQEAYQRASNVINPQMQQLKNNLILRLSQQRKNDVSNLASRGQSVGGQRELAEANLNSEEALQGSNILLQGDIAKNQLAEQYMATANEEAQRQQALAYQQYMDRMNLDRQNRMDSLNERKFEVEQENYLADVKRQEKIDAIEAEYKMGLLSIDQAKFELDKAESEYNMSRPRSTGGGGGSSYNTPSGMTDQEIRFQAIKMATDSDGTFNQATFNRIYNLLKPVSFVEPRLINGRGTTTTPTTKKSDVPPLEW